MSPPATYALTARGAALGRRLAQDLGGPLFLPRRLDPEGFASLPELVARTFAAHQAHVFVGALGIAVRAVAPHLRGKAVDPAVVAVSEDGRFVIPVLSGHLGGANDLARRIAGLPGLEDSVAVVTTATDLAGIPAVDLLARDLGLAIAEPGRIKTVSAAQLAGIKALLHDPRGYLQECLRLKEDAPLTDFYTPMTETEFTAALGHHGAGDAPRPAVWVHWRRPPAGEVLALHPRVLAVGLGCKRGTPARDILAAVEQALAAAGVALPAVATLASVDIKADEPGLLQAAAHLGVPVEFYPAEQLARVAVPNPSERVLRQVGCPGVCEAAAVLAAGNGPLLVEKVRAGGVTVAVALREAQ